MKLDTYSLWFAAAGFALALPACGDDDLQPIEKASALTSMKTNLSQNLIEAQLTLESFETEMPAGSMPQMPNTMTKAEIEKAIDELVARSDVEDEGSAKIVFKVNAQRACESDAKCIESLNKVPVRYALTSKKQGDIDVEIFLGEPKKSAAILELHKELIAAEADLAVVNTAAKSLAPITGEAVDFDMSGRPRVQLQKNADKDFTLSVSAITNMQARFEAVSTFMNAANPAVSVRFDGNTKAVDMALALNAFGFEAPYKTFDSDAAVNGILALRADALKGSTTIKADAKSLTVAGLSIGSGIDFTYDGMELASFDLAADKITVAEIADAIRVSVSPEFRADLALRLANLPVTMDVPAWAQDDDLVIDLDGANEPTFTVREDAGDEHSLLAMEAGKLTLSSRAADKTVTVEAGMCLNADASFESETTNPFISLAAGQCK